MNSKASGKIVSKKYTPQLIELFVDSTEIGRRSFNKIELADYKLADSNYVVLKFYSKQNSKWVLKNDFRLSKDSIHLCDPEISDFNNDGQNDFTFVSAVAARLSNAIRTLFIYDKENDRLIHIRNSQDYPNMLYNKKLNCIDAFIFSSCTETAFLKLEKDTLREFASVEQCDSLTVTIYDKKGNGKVIMKKKGNRDDFIRYDSYSPLKKYHDNP